MIGSVAGRGLSAADDGLRVAVVQSVGAFVTKLFTSKRASLSCNGVRHGK